MYYVLTRYSVTSAPDEAEYENEAEAIAECMRALKSGYIVELIEE